MVQCKARDTKAGRKLSGEDTPAAEKPCRRDVSSCVMKEVRDSKRIERILRCPANEFPANPMPGIDAGFMQGDRIPSSSQCDSQRKSGQAATDNGDYPFHAIRRNEPRQSTDSSIFQPLSLSSSGSSPRTNPASMLAGISCRVTAPQIGRISAPRKCGSRARHGSQKHRTLYSPAISPIRTSVSSAKWCNIITPKSPSPSQPRSLSRRSPCLHEIAFGRAHGRGARSRPVSAEPGNQADTLRHKRPSPAPSSIRRSVFPADICFVARQRALLIQWTFPISAFIVRRSCRPRSADGSSAGRWSRISLLMTLPIAIFRRRA